MSVIIGRYPNFADLSSWIRRVSLRRMSESSLNMSTCSKSVIKSYYGGGPSIKPTCVLGTAGPTRLAEFQMK
jgi:hypothetical protein